MAGTKAGGLKASVSNKERHGADYYARIGAIGGSRSNPNKGFGRDSRSLIQKVLRKPTHASRAGKVGGTISKRRPHEV